MKRSIKNILTASIAALVFMTWCGIAMAAPRLTPFLQVDLDGAGGPTQPGWTSLPIASVASPTYAWTNTYGGVTVTILTTNYNNSWNLGVRNRTAETDTNFLGPVYQDLLFVQHTSSVGWGEDFYTINFSGLVANTNYEVTLFDYDSSYGLSGDLAYAAWSTTNPAAWLANISYNNGYNPGDTAHTPPIIAQNLMAGPFSADPAVNDPYAYSSSFIVTTDPTGSATVYGWANNTAITSSQHIPLNGYMLGGPTSLSNNFVLTNQVVTVINPVTTSYGPPVAWPYTAGIAVSASAYTDQPFGASTLMGQTFTATRDFLFRDFYIACSGTTNSGRYLLVLYDLGTGGSPASFTPGTYTNLLSHPLASTPAYWSFSPNGRTNAIVECKLTAPADQVYCTNSHTYYLGFQYSGYGSNDMVLETSGTAFTGGTSYSGDTTNQTSGTGDFVMAVGVLNPNPQISVTSYALSGSWPNVAIATPTSPLMAPYFDPQNGNGGSWDGSAAESSPMTVNVGSCVSMSFIATNNFKLAAISMRQHGYGSSNLLFTLSVYDITNSFFSVTNTVNKWPFNFVPNIDSSPKGIPVIGTNVDFYYTAANGANGPGQGTNDQLLVLTITNSAYQPLMKSNHNYVVEISTDYVGENTGNIGMFQWIRDTGGIFQQELFPDTGGGAGYATNSASTNMFYYVLPRALSRADTDPETMAGDVVASGVRDMIMAIYAAPAPPAQPTSIHISSVTHGPGTVTLNWNTVPTGSFTFSVYKSSTVGASFPSGWTQIATGVTANTYTDNSATGSQAFYRVTSQ
jgi:hypothetical protein